jgi:hypothetical protein
MAELISDEDWEEEKFQGWNRWHCLRAARTDDMYVADKDQNIVALICGDKLFLNTDMIESMEGTYTERVIPKDGDDPIPV